LYGRAGARSPCLLTTSRPLSTVRARRGIARKDVDPPPEALARRRCALGGRDVVITRAGRDVALGANGADRLAGGPGDDRLNGVTGGDRLKGGRGKDVLIGGPGRDVCFGKRGQDRFRSCEEIVSR